MHNLSDSDASETQPCVPTENPRRKRKRIRTNEVMKHLRLSSHCTGEDCNCTRLKCFQEVSEEGRRWIIRNYNEFGSHNEQSAYLAGLISTHTVKRRRSRGDPTISLLNMHTMSYSYKVRYIEDKKVVEKPVCYKAFLAMHGISNKRVQNIKKALVDQGTPKVDMRGKHSNHKHALPQETKAAIMEHISKFKGRKSHYNIKDTQKIYLPEELNVKKMHQMFLKDHPTFKVSYDTYRIIFSSNFNIAFGYPRSDTCSFCDETKAKVMILENDGVLVPENSDKENALKQLIIELKVHHLKAQKFYSIKRQARIKAGNDPQFGAYCFDFQKNLSLPNVTTNNAYYCRQLSFYLLNIHQLSTRSSYFYAYDETRGKKGADDVVSFLHNFVTQFIPSEVKKVFFFCDSCSGQNKNYTIIRYIYFLVHILKRFDSVIIVFPVRGHSYMECDKNMALINLKTPCELPEDWISVVEKARTNPEPFNVIDCQLFMFKKFSQLFKYYFVNKCPFASRPVRMLQVKKKAPGKILARSNHYTGPYESFVCIKNSKNAELPDNIKNLYKNPVKVPKAKYDDLQVLKRFCTNSEAQSFYTNSPTCNKKIVKKKK